MTGISYGGNSGGISTADKTKLANITVPSKSNISASAAPSVIDDSSKGYASGSTWNYLGTTYTCSDSTVGAAVWSNPTDIYYFTDWAALVAAINVAGSTYVGKFANVTNANTAPSVLVSTYTAPAVITSPIADGNGAVYKVLAMGVGTYSVKLASRPPAAFRVTSIPTGNFVKPVVAGYYIFTTTPTNGLPAGVALNDIAQLASDNITWGVFQTYANADATIPVGTTATSIVTWRKTNNTWTDGMPKVRTFPAGLSFWVPTLGTKYTIIEMIGGGGSGGYPSPTNSTGGYTGSGGSGAGYIKAMFTPDQFSANHNINVGFAGNNGMDGGTSNIASLIVANGGRGGNSSATTGAFIFSVPIAPYSAGTTTGVLIDSAQGGYGGFSISPTQAATGVGQCPVTAGNGGSSRMGTGGQSSVDIYARSTESIGTVATGYGAGGAGVAGYSNTGVRGGVSGSPGYCIITEYF
jgi:hypothetical protein